MRTNDWKLIKTILQEKMMSSTSESLDAQIAIILSEIEGKIAYLDEPMGSCKYCGNTFSDLDMKVKDSRPKDICTACFTSNA